MRALRLSTLEESAIATVSRTKYIKLCNRGEAFDKVTRFLRRYSYINKDREKAKPYSQERYLDLLVGYLTNQPAVGKFKDLEDKIVVLDITSAISLI